MAFTKTQRVKVVPYITRCIGSWIPKKLRGVSLLGVDRKAVTLVQCWVVAASGVAKSGRSAPLVVLDVGGAVAGVTWSPFSSSVFVAVTDEGRVYVYDLFLRRCRPLCVQSLLQRRRVAATSVAFNPFHPIVVLSPNLRKPHKDAKGADAQRLRELELYKMERLIATSNNTSG
ncbi:Dynein intermediate chain 2, ciliary [Portunus trituberculatus]|uniref:Dynein intermediate chain 2, ciliary n=1 Tax=Portunus trituberculatus TaxID=210409 RepID=A0A5B7D9Z9_PORTR|nr:Dynein intermediate chain 2, ciliary [Portunus trituberculatus]